MYTHIYASSGSSKKIILFGKQTIFAWGSPEVRQLLLNKIIDFRTVLHTEMCLKLNILTNVIHRKKHKCGLDAAFEGVLSNILSKAFMLL